MDATVDQNCPSCGEPIHTSGRIESVTGVGMAREIAVAWDCPTCEATYEHEHPIDYDVMDMSGFESWVGTVSDATTCIIVNDEQGPMS